MDASKKKKAKSSNSSSSKPAAAPQKVPAQPPTAKPPATPVPTPPAPKPSPKPAPAAPAPKPAPPVAAPEPTPTPPKPAPTPAPAPPTAAKLAPKGAGQPKPPSSPPPLKAPEAKPAPKAAASAKPTPASAPAPAPTPTPIRGATRTAPTTPSKPDAPPPSILLEGDASPTPPASGPGGRFVLAPTPTASGSPPEPLELPASYGTRRLLLVARDPHWLYAHWDLSDSQLREANQASASGSLVLRIRSGSPTSEVVVEQPVHPESRNWFIHVPQAGARYLGELGYYDSARSWVQVSTSSATLTPRDELSEETWVRFETLPFEMPMAQIVALVKQALADNTPLIEAIQQLRQAGHPNLPLPVRVPHADGTSLPAWTPAQEQALAEMLSMDEVRRVWIGSLEITELLRRQLQRGLSSAGLPIAGPSSGAVGAPGISSLSSPFGGETPGARGFWFNVNAELVVYGATDPHATVAIGNRPIRLRPDGTFSYRFALPDGDYSLPIVATSPDAVEQREANLDFRRASVYRGEVPPHPQDPSLRTPTPDHVA